MQRIAYVSKLFMWDWEYNSACHKTIMSQRLDAQAYSGEAVLEIT